MNSNFWIDRWKKNEIGFHEDEFNSYLTKYFNDIPKGTVFVPLCGKSRDIEWLAQSGRQVVGVELSEIACESFFKENKRSFKTENHGELTIFDGGDVKLWCGNFFNFSPENFSSVTSIYDRAALIALPPKMRELYVRKLQSLVRAVSKPIEILLITIEYQSDEIEGPPFSVTDKEVVELYSPFSKVKTLESNIEPISKSSGSKLSGLTITERVFKITCNVSMSDNSAQ